MRSNKLLAFFLLSHVFAATLSADTIPQRYGEWVSYSEGQALVFPDFRLTFLGRTAGPPYPGSSKRLGDVFHFQVDSPKSQTKVQWSSGTGEIAPRRFSLDGKEFMLEMLSSEALPGSLREFDELIVWPRELWLQRTQEPAPRARQ